MNSKIKIFFLKRGFTLTELLVTVSIVAVIMSVILFSYSTFNDNLTVSSATQEISVATRQTQIYGLSVKESGSATGVFTVGYGIYFSLDDSQNYYLFVDQNNNGKYDGTSTCTSGGECIQKIPIRSGVRVSSFCGATFSSGLACPPSGTIRSMHITFVRPSVDARIKFFDSAGAQYGSLFQTGRVNLSSNKGKIGTVTVENTGQISVQ